MHEGRREETREIPVLIHNASILPYRPSLHPRVYFFCLPAALCLSVSVVVLAYGPRISHAESLRRFLLFSSSLPAAAAIPAIKCLFKTIIAGKIKAVVRDANFATEHEDVRRKAALVPAVPAKASLSMLMAPHLP